MSGIEGMPAMPPGVPALIEGMPVGISRGHRSATKFYHDRLIVKCRTHPDCQKSRSCELLKHEFGDRAAEFYLGAWQLRDDLPQLLHNGYRPKIHEIREYARNHA